MTNYYQMKNKTDKGNRMTSLARLADGGCQFINSETRMIIFYQFSFSLAQNKKPILHKTQNRLDSMDIGHVWFVIVFAFGTHSCVETVFHCSNNTIMTIINQPEHS